MPAWGATLSDVEIASVITYERNSWGNHTGDVLEPAQVSAARNGKLPEGGDHTASAGGAAAAAPDAGIAASIIPKKPETIARSSDAKNPGVSRPVPAA